MSIASKNRKRNERRRRLSVAALEAKCKLATRTARQAIAERDHMKTAFDALLHERLRFRLAYESIEASYDVKRAAEAFRRERGNPYLIRDIEHPVSPDIMGPLIRELDGYHLGWRFVQNTFHPQYKQVQYLQSVADEIACVISERIVDSLLEFTQEKTQPPQYVCRPAPPPLFTTNHAPKSSSEMGELAKKIMAMPEDLPIGKYFEAIHTHLKGANETPTNPTAANQGVADAPKHNQGGPDHEVGKPVPVEEADTGGVETLPGSSGAQTRWPEEYFDL